MAKRFGFIVWLVLRKDVANLDVSCVCVSGRVSDRVPYRLGRGCHERCLEAFRGIKVFDSFLQIGRNVAEWSFLKRCLSSAAIRAKVCNNCQKTLHNFKRNLSSVMLAGGLSSRIASAVKYGSSSRLACMTRL